MTAVVTGVDFITIPTQNFADATAFYGEVLGLECTAKYGRFPGAEYQAGNLTLQVIEAAAMGRPFVPHAFPIALQVQEMATARPELESRGVKFTHKFDSGVCHNAVFSDPDGNALMLHERYAPRD